MSVSIKASTLNPNKAFNLDGQDFPLNIYAMEYGGIDPNGGTAADEHVGIKNKYTGKWLVEPRLYSEYTNGITPFASVDDLVYHIITTLGLGFNVGGPSSGTTYAGYVIIDSLADLPAPSAGVITLAADTAYKFTQYIDLGGDRIVCPDGPVAILGTSSETAFITSTGLSASTALITATRTLVIQNITVINVGTAFDIDGTGGTNVALDWNAFNIINVPTMGVIQNIDNAIWTTCAILSSAGLTYSGDFNTVAFNNSIATSTSTGTIFNFDSNAVVGRRVRFTYSSIVAGAPTSTGIYFHPLVTLPTESFILDTINFSGGGTYIDGPLATNNEALFVNNIGILNSREISNYYMNDNATATTIGASNTPTKASGTTTSNPITQKFTNTDNRATYVGATQRTLKVQATCSVVSGNNHQIGVYIALNGTPIDSSEVYGTTDGSGRRENIVVQAIIDFNENDYIEVWMENRTSATDITMTDLNLIIN